MGAGGLEEEEDDEENELTASCLGEDETEDCDDCELTSEGWTLVGRARTPFRTRIPRMGMGHMDPAFPAKPIPSPLPNPLPLGPPLRVVE